MNRTPSPDSGIEVEGDVSPPVPAADPHPQELPPDEGMEEVNPEGHDDNLPGENAPQDQKGIPLFKLPIFEFDEELEENADAGSSHWLDADQAFF
uniref:Amphiphysin n=1 Tax=Panagrellus redivivus TaxID=6233 RepID=A0A7E4ZSM5_PANRE